MANIFKRKYEEAKEAASKARKKAAELRGSKRYEQVARGVAAVGVLGATGGFMDPVINALPGGHFGAGDYKKAPNGLLGKRFLALAVAGLATGVMLDGPEANASFVLAAAAGRALAIDSATYRRKSGALTDEQLAKDIGAERAANVKAANGYPG